MILKLRDLISIIGLAIFLFYTQSSIAQVDTLYLKNSDVIVGELKSLNKSVAIFETD
ncbi:hypothetical protein [Mesohalobacter salilacus]|uniref:hypothetical protein n=1 Tax=Mesohalobacter salilacus TaxID=2491711 RepID=UPI0026B1E171